MRCIPLADTVVKFVANEMENAEIIRGEDIHGVYIVGEHKDFAEVDVETSRIPMYLAQVRQVSDSLLEFEGFVPMRGPRLY